MTSTKTTRNPSSIELIRQLSSARGAPGFEDEVLDAARPFIDSQTVRTESDSLRNLYLYRSQNSGDRPVIMLDGHSDEVGFMIQSVTREGMLKIMPLGGWAPQTVLAQKVAVRSASGKWIPGLVAAKPPHFMKESEKSSAVNIEDMVIDVGAVSAEEITDVFGIEPGAPVVPHADFEYNSDTGVMLGKAFDNRLGCAAVVETLARLSDAELAVDVVGVFSSQEEAGLRGAQVAARKVKPQAAIVFEGAPADDFHGNAEARQGVLKKGPQIRHADRSMIANPRFTRFARETAQMNQVPFQDAVRASGGTDGGSIHLSGAGIPTIVISVPVRYIHSPYGFAALADFEHAVDWCEALLKRIKPEDITSF